MKRLFSVISFCLVALFLFGCPGLQDGGPGIPGLPTEAPPATATPIPPQTDAIAVWQHQGVDWDVYYSLWDDAAQEWWVPSGGKSAPVKIFSGDDHDPDVSTNQKDRAVAVWSHDPEQQGLTTGYDIYYSIWQGNTWSSPKAIEAMEGKDTDPTVAVKDGKAMAVWVHTEESSSTLYYSVLTGTYWSSPKKLWESGKEDYKEIVNPSLPELAYAPELDAFVVAWTQRESPNRAYASFFAGNAWTPPEKIDGQSSPAIYDVNTPTDERVGIDADWTGKLAVVWPSEEGQAWVSQYNSQWVKTNAFSEKKMPDVAYDSSYVSHAAFSKSTGSNFGLYHSKDPISANAIQPITSTNFNDYRPSITFISQRAVGLVVWWDSGATDTEIYYGRYDGSSWATGLVDPMRLVGPDRNPAVAPLRGAMPTIQQRTYCGDGVVQSPNSLGWFEECEKGVACPMPNEWCDENWCLCYEEEDEPTWCGDGIIDWPNDAGQFEECEVGVGCLKANEWCDLTDCTCWPDEDEVTHLACVNESCTAVLGAGVDECFFDRDCWHYGCVEETCSKVPQPGIDECQTDADCFQGRHLGCMGPYCTSLIGEGEDECQTDDDCTHLACEDQACVKVYEPGEDECAIDADCQATCGNGQTEFGEQCDTGGGEKADGSYYPAARDTCPDGGSCGSDCQCTDRPVTPRCGDGYISDLAHGGTEECDLGGKYNSPVLPDSCPSPKTCANCKCIQTVCGNGVCEEGESWEDCPLDCFTHGECVEGACTQVSGLGTSECSTDSECRHSVCNSQWQCVEMMVPGIDECQTSADCVPEETHKVCQGSKCVEVAGAGVDMCVYDYECQEYVPTPTEAPTEGWCGDGILDPMFEECEQSTDCPEGYACISCTCLEFQPTIIPPTPTPTPYCGDGVCEYNEHQTMRTCGVECEITECPDDCPQYPSDPMDCAVDCSSVCAGNGLYVNSIASDVGQSACSSAISALKSQSAISCYTACVYGEYCYVGGCCCVAPVEYYDCNDCPGEPCPCQGEGCAARIVCPTCPEYPGTGQYGC